MYFVTVFFSTGNAKTYSVINRIDAFTLRRTLEGSPHVIRILIEDGIRQWDKRVG